VPKPINTRDIKRNYKLNIKNESCPHWIKDLLNSCIQAFKNLTHLSHSNLGVALDGSGLGLSCKEGEKKNVNGVQFQVA
jgi:hypothetical protein